MAWLMDHRAEFVHLVRDRLGDTAAVRVLWSASRLICVAGDFTRNDLHAAREHRRSIDLDRYRFFGTNLLGLETVASVAERIAVAKRARRHSGGLPQAHGQAGALAALAEAVDEVLLGLGVGGRQCGAAQAVPRVSALANFSSYARRRRPGASSTSRPIRRRSTSTRLHPGRDGARSPRHGRPGGAVALGEGRGEGHGSLPRELRSRRASRSLWQQSTMAPLRPWPDQA